MRTLSLTLCVLALPLLCQAQGHPQWLPPLVDTGAVVECPDHEGLRQYRSETAAYKGIAAFISAESRRDSHGCHYSAKLQIVRNGVAHKYSLPNARNQAFSIVDFSPDGSSLLLAGELVLGGQNGRDFRDVEITTASLPSGIGDWQNAWDIFRWHDCDATVEPQGFTSDGRVILSARPPVYNLPPHRSCVAAGGLYQTEMAAATTKKMPDSLRIKRYSAVTKGPQHTCEKDPDIVAKCFVVRGRVSFYNGGPSTRIWKVGTNRMLGVVDEVLPGELDLRLNWDTEAFGDFDLCPFTHEKPGVMQFVCIESVKNVKYKKIE